MAEKPKAPSPKEPAKPADSTPPASTPPTSEVKPAETAPEVPQIITRTVSGDLPLNVRKTPDGKIIDAVDPGTELEIAGESKDGWVPVRVPGFVREEFLTE